jgi:hypothetical protein
VPLTGNGHQLVRRLDQTQLNLRLATA